MLVLKRLLGSSSERGASAILVASSLTLIFGVAALVLDIGNARTERLELQNAADSGALAGAFELPSDAPAARQVAAEFAFESLDLTVPSGVACAADTECFTVGRYTLRVISPYSDPLSSIPANEQVRVRTCTSSPTFFGRIFGTSQVAVCGEAVAAARSGGGTGDCVICVLGPTGTTFSSTGAGTVDVKGGDIVINSSDSQALSLTGGGKVTTDSDFGIYGGYSATAGALTPLPTYHEPVPDPLAHLPVPSLAGSPAPKVSISGSADMNLTPGIYSEIVSSSSGQITLQPGIYVVTKQIKLSKSPAPGKASLYAHGVMIYFACQNYPTPCAPGEKGGTLSGSGGVVMDWTPPTSGTYKGMSVFYDRENANEFTLTGSSGTVFDGTIYMKSGTLSMTGPSGVTTSMDSMVVVDNLKKTGDSAIAIDYNAANGPAGVGGSGGGNRRLVG